MKNILLTISNIALGSYLLLETYMNIPIKLLYQQKFPQLPNYNNSDGILLLFPGFNGPDDNTKHIIDTIKETDIYFGTKRLVYCYDWSLFKGNIIRASSNSKEIGKAIGKQLALRNLKGKSIMNEIHIIGISVGAFAADACVQEYNKYIKLHYNDINKSNQIKTRLTLLDPFFCHGLFHTNYGIKYFGKSADYCENYYNTDDPVPFTNQPLLHAYNYDITNMKEKSLYKTSLLHIDSMHSWPIVYYGLNFKKKLDPRLNNNDNHHSKKRGFVEYVT